MPTDFEDIPFEVRAALYDMTLGKSTRMPLAHALNRINLGHHYQTIWAQIKGTSNITPNTVLQLCRVYDDYTPLNMLMAAHDVTMNVEVPHKHSNNVIMEIAEAAGEVGRLNSELALALRNRKISAEERSKLAVQAEKAITELRDVIAAATHGRN